MNPTIEPEILAFLEVARTASLATVGDDGRPHAANVQYAIDTPLTLFFVSSPTSLHALHVAAKPEVALTIYGHPDTPQHIHGVQLHGRCSELRGDARERARRVYAAKYPFVNSPPFDELIDRQTVFGVTPTWLRWIDNRVRFGFKIEKRWGASER